MAVYDFRCEDCGHVEMDLYYPVEKLPKRRKCGECGKLKSVQAFDLSKRKALINMYAPGVGYGMVHPQTMEVMDSYATKQKWKKKYGWEECADPVGGNRKMSEEAYHDESQPDPDEDAVEWMTYDEAQKVAKEPTEITVG